MYMQDEMRGKFRTGRIPPHLKTSVQEGILYPIVNNIIEVRIITSQGTLSFSDDEVECEGENKPDAILLLKTQEQFVDEMLKNFERDGEL